MQFVVLGGAGIEGSGIVKDLVRSGVDEVAIADRDVDKAQSLAADLASDRTRVSAVRVDADDQASLVKVLQNAGVVVSALGPFYRYGLKTVRASIEARAPYVDINDDFDAIEAVLGLDAEAMAAGIPVVVGLGVTPGVSNVCVKHAAGRMDWVCSVDIAYVGGCRRGRRCGFPAFLPQPLRPHPGAAGRQTDMGHPDRRSRPGDRLSLALRNHPCTRHRPPGADHAAPEDSGDRIQSGVLCPEQCITPLRLFAELDKRGIRVIIN